MPTAEFCLPARPASVRLPKATLQEVFMRKLLLAAAAAAALPGTAFAQDPSDLVDARQGFFTLMGLNIGPLAGMARGEIDYDAARAATHAANLAALGSYNPMALFAPGTSNADLPGETRALPAIWENTDDVGAKFAAYAEAAQALAAVAGDGRAEMGAALGAVGQTCQACHDDYRAEDF
jgi:cytochrome c556